MICFFIGVLLCVSIDSPKEQDFSKLVSQYLSELELGTAPDKLNKVHEMVKQWIVDFDSHDSRETDSVKVNPSNLVLFFNLITISILSLQSNFVILQSLPRM